MSRHRGARSGATLAASSSRLSAVPQLCRHFRNPVRDEGRQMIGTLDLALFALSTLRLGFSTLIIPLQTIRQSHLNAAGACCSPAHFRSPKSNLGGDGRSRAFPNTVPLSEIAGSSECLDISCTSNAAK